MQCLLSMGLVACCSQNAIQWLAGFHIVHNVVGTRTLAELSDAEKNAISRRARAVHALGENLAAQG